MIFKKVFHFMGLIWSMAVYSREPSNVKLTFRFADHLLALEAYDAMKEILISNPVMTDLIKKRKMPITKTLEELSLCAEGSLGKILAHYMISNHLTLDFYPILEIRTDEHYILQRMRSIHDIVHIITGFDTSEGGELGLQSFLMAQIASPFSMIIIGGMILFAPFKKPKLFFQWVDHIASGWIMGRRAKLLLAHDWDRTWNEPLEKIRKELNIIL